MKTPNSRTALVGAGALAAATLILAWGPLDPPPGPPQPTMHTLDEIYGKVAELPPGKPWEFLAFKKQTVNEKVIEGSGLLHAIYVYSDQGGTANVATGGRLVLSLIPDWPVATTVALDVRYEDGITLGLSNTTCMTILYRPDGQ